MAINFPTSKDDSTSIPVPTGTNTQNNPDHASLHSLKQQAIIALETKVGTGSSTPASNTLLFGTGPGTSNWTALTSAQLAATLSDETGTGSAVFATTPTLVTPKIDTINENTVGNGTTVGGVNIKSGALNTNNSVPTAAIASSAVTSDKVAVGMVVQVVSTNFSTVATGTTLIPWDDTIPQSTEGDQYMTQAITPKATTNRLLIEAVTMTGSSATNHHIIALFQDSTAGALAADGQYQVTISGAVTLRLQHDMAAGTTSATTFKIRLGQESPGTLTFNGVGGGRKFGNITVSNIKITEYKG